jgi:hypothetical protein
MNGQYGGKSIDVDDNATCEKLMKGKNHTNYFWNYYEHCPNLHIHKFDLAKYKQIYEETKNKLEKESISTFEKFIDAWLKDASEEKETIGPNFSMATCEYFDTCDVPTNVMNVVEDWFMSAAIYDMIWYMILSPIIKKINLLN